MRCAAFIIAATLAMAQTPAAVLEVFRSAAEALSQKNSSAFLDVFDGDMPGYLTLRDEIETLLSSSEVGSSIEIVSDEGDDQKRSLELDWILEVEDRKPRRQIVKVRLERRGKSWKITALDPIEFFKY
jgi:hypothetical protein